MSTTVTRAPLLTIAETAERLRVSEKTIRRLVRAQILPAIRIGHSVRVDPGELDEWLSDSAVGGSFDSHESMGHSSVEAGDPSTPAIPAERDDGTHESTAGQSSPPSPLAGREGTE